MKFFFFFLIAFFWACGNPEDKAIVLESGDLFMINTPEALQDKDTLNVFYSDRSQIHESAYQSLKSNMVLYLNRKELSSEEWIKTITYIPLTDQFLSKTYHREDLDFLNELYGEHPLFKDFARYLLTNFNATELYNFSNACHAIIRHAGIQKGDYMDILFRFSIEAQMDGFETSTGNQLIQQVKEMVAQAGLKEHNTGKRVSPDRLIEHLRYFYTTAGHSPPF